MTPEAVKPDTPAPATPLAPRDTAGGDLHPRTGKPRTQNATRRIKARTSLLAHGEPMIWLTGGALCVSLFMIVGLLVLIVIMGGNTFWPPPVVKVTTYDGKVLMGEVTRDDQFVLQPHVLAQLPPEVARRAEEAAEAGDGLTHRRLIRTGNFELTGEHFNWVSDFAIQGQPEHPEWALVVERMEWGRFYGLPRSFAIDGKTVATDPADVWAQFQQHHGPSRDRWEQVHDIERNKRGDVNQRIENARLAARKAQLEYGDNSPEHAAAVERAEDVQQQAQEQFKVMAERIAELRKENERFTLELVTADGKAKVMPLAEIVRMYPANQLSVGGKLGVYASRWGEFLLDWPREANSEGGVFPAIVGTVIMTLVMSLLVVPFGVFAALYLREYAKAGPVISMVRIAINNLAGVPSIVFGVFGLGFFVYVIGAYIDGGPRNSIGTVLPGGTWFTLLLVLSLAVVAGAVLMYFGYSARGSDDTPRKRTLRLIGTLAALLGAGLGLLLIATTPFFEGFFPERVADGNPWYGKTALIWASFTLALLTLPVVIVATEEALTAVPNSMREGSYACGASKWQTIRRIVLPRAMPGIMTGMILAMARGAGEVAPLMLVGAIKLVEKLPMSLDPSQQFGINRSFMHLGFHIYDLGFQSQNSEAAKPMVFTTTLLLIAIVALLNVAAIGLRSRLRRKFLTSAF